MDQIAKTGPVYTIYLDHPIARRLRRHLLVGPGPDDFEYHAAFDVLLMKLYDKDITECKVIGETHSFMLCWSLSPPDTEADHGQTPSPAA